MSDGARVPDDVLAEVEGNLDDYEAGLIEALSKSTGAPLPEGWREKFIAKRQADRKADGHEAADPVG